MIAHVAKEFKSKAIPNFKRLFSTQIKDQTNVNSTNYRHTFAILQYNASSIKMKEDNKLFEQKLIEDCKNLNINCICIYITSYTVPTRA